MSFLRAGRALLCGTALAIAAFAPAAQARHYQILHSFTGSDGSNPRGDMVLDSAGDLHGVVSSGGASGKGGIFTLSAAGAFTLVYSFTGLADGAYPQAGLALDPTTDDLYGTTYEGGANNRGGIFKLTPAGALTVLHDFDEDTDGAVPYAALTRDAEGNFYGTTYEGGSGDGTVFELAADGDFKVLHAFGPGDGGEPLGRLALSGTDLYGTTTDGGSGSGTIYRLDLDGTFTVLKTANQGEGMQGVVHDKKGNLYGGYASGHGMIYELRPDGTMSSLFTFGDYDGVYPIGDLLLTRRRPRDLYGVASGDATNFYGTVFKLDLKGNFTLLHTFAGAPRDGSSPSGGLVRSNGRLYGTTFSGGADDMGTIYSVANE